MARRYYSSTAQATTLNGAVNSSVTTLVVTAATGFPSSFPYTMVVDPDTINEEIVEVTARSGTSLTVTRGVDGSTAVSHSSGAVVRHGVSARDFDEPNSHVNASSGVHGLSGSVVGTSDSQALTNKTINIASNTLTGVAPAASPTFTGVVAVPAGSASAPSIVPTGDTNTGIYSPGADQLAIATGGTQRVVVDASGNMGIGAAPLAAQPLEIQSTAFGARVYRFSATSSSGPGINFLKSATGTVGSHALVVDGELMGRVLFSASDGVIYRDSAEIRAAVDGAPGVGDMPGRLMFLTSADGAATPTEKMRIASDGLITGTGTSLGAWTSFTPSWTASSVNPSLGNGTIDAKYCQVGKKIVYRGTLTLGSTTTIGTGNYYMQLPVSAVTTMLHPLGMALYFDTSTGTYYYGKVDINDATNKLTFRIDNVASTYPTLTTVTAAVPMTWADGDKILWQIIYEAA